MLESIDQEISRLLCSFVVVNDAPGANVKTTSCFPKWRALSLFLVACGRGAIDRLSVPIVGLCFLSSFLNQPGTERFEF